MDSGETPVSGQNHPEKDKKDEVFESPEVNVPLNNEKGDDDSDTDDFVIDVYGKILDSPAFSNNGGDDIIRDNVEGCYVYKNVFNLIPRSLGRLGKLKILKFFANEVNLFPAEFRNLAELESLQVKISAPGLSGLKLDKLKSLKELDLSQAPPRPSAFYILREIAGLKTLTRLSVCHFSIRYLPPEIGCLNNLEYLDLSFNKMRSLPTEITFLNNLIALKIANNKLVDLPTSLSSLQKLNDLDLSNNRLTSLGCLELGSMHNLQCLNLQYNKLPSSCQIPLWMRCNLEGNVGDALETEFPSCSVEMDVLESSVQEIHGSPRDGASTSSSSYFIGSPSSSRSFASRKSSKGWKRRYYYQQRARQERLNSSRKWKADDSTDGSLKATDKCKLSLVSESSTDAPSATADPEIDDNENLSGDAEYEEPLTRFSDNSSQKKYCKENCSLIVLESVVKRTDESHECTKHESCLESLSNVTDVPDESSALEASNINSKSKRHPEKDLDNPKPSKSRRPFEMHFNLSSKYNKLSFCSIEDHLPDGFYDAGRDRPFMPLSSYEQNLHINSREVILLDRESDEELDVITLCAQALVSQFKQVNGSSNKREQNAIDDLQVASLLALFVSDHFGGSDKSVMIERTRKAVSGSNYMKPFVCTCQTGNSESIRKPLKDGLDSVQDIVVQDLCEKSLQSIKTTQNSIIAPIGALRFGVCRHRALLLKYLCDRMEPKVPCELVRGYLDFYPHAWNVIVTKKGDSWVRMIVDACRPHDIRTETDKEYSCRYIPLSCVDISITGEKILGPRCSFPSLSSCDEIGKAGSTKLIRCNLGSVVAAAKVRTIDVCGTSADETKNFELNCLGEVRILRALENSCIIKLYGHQISSKWAPSSDKKPEHRTLQSAILMEYIKGGSLKDYLKKLSRAGEKHVQTELALNIARDVAHALLELHSKDIIHRDVKSENILIDLDSEREDGTTVVKLCDFDRAIPLRSFLHSCCISHNGIPPPDICVGTPRWMAPEVFRTMHKRDLYGLEVDIWSFGCLLLELLTLEVPYSDVAEANIHDHLQIGKRPRLTDELEALISKVDPTMVLPSTELEDPKADTETLKFLIGLYRQCTEENPTDRPTAETLYNILLTRTNSLTRSRKLEEE